MFRLTRQLVKREFAEWRRLVHIRELEKLSDRQLVDIGLRRDQLFMLEVEPPRRETQKPFWEPIYRPRVEPCG